MSCRRAFAASLAACLASPALAQIDLRTDEQRAAPKTWNVTVGARIGAAPAFPVITVTCSGAEETGSCPRFAGRSRRGWRVGEILQLDHVPVNNFFVEYVMNDCVRYFL
jgi:hypothetical protein